MHACMYRMRGGAGHPGQAWARKTQAPPPPRGGMGKHVDVVLVLPTIR